MRSLREELQEDLIAEALEAPATRPKRYTDWNNRHSFVHDGWVAVCREETCECCGAKSRQALGVFAVERQIGTNNRRMTRALDWPQSAARVMEVEQTFIDYCAQCLSALGFSEEIPAPQTRTLRITQP